MEKFFENCIIKCSAFDLWQIIDFDFDKYLPDKCFPSTISSHISHHVHFTICNEERAKYKNAYKLSELDFELMALNIFVPLVHLFFALICSTWKIEQWNCVENECKNSATWNASGKFVGAQKFFRCSNYPNRTPFKLPKTIQRNHNYISQKSKSFGSKTFCNERCAWVFVSHEHRITKNLHFSTTKHWKQ